MNVSETNAIVPAKPLLYLRAVVWWLVFAIVTVALTIPVLIGLMVSYETGYRIIHVWLGINLWTLKHICRINWQVSGIENLPPNPTLVLCKHQSTFETLVLPAMLQSPVFVAKRELALVPFFGWCLAFADTILIKRGAGRSAIRQMETQSVERFARKRCVVIFPEGTRREPGAAPEYRIGGAVLAKRTNTPIIPIAHNFGEYWPRHSLIKWPGTAEMRIGPAIAVEGKKPDAILQEVVDWIERQQKEITVVDRFPY